MSGEMGGPGDQPVSGRRGGLQYAGLDDDRRADRGCRRTLVSELADRTHIRRVGLLVRVGALDGRDKEQRKGDGGCHRGADARPRSSKTGQVCHVALSLAPRNDARSRETGADTDGTVCGGADQGGCARGQSPRAAKPNGSRANTRRTIGSKNSSGNES